MDARHFLKHLHAPPHPTPQSNNDATGTSFSRRLATPSPPPSAIRCSRGANDGAQASGVTTRAAPRARSRPASALRTGAANAATRRAAANAPWATRARATQRSAKPTAVGKGARSPTAARAPRRGPWARAARTAVVRAEALCKAKHMCNGIHAIHSLKHLHAPPQPTPHTSIQ